MKKRLLLYARSHRFYIQRLFIRFNSTKLTPSTIVQLDKLNEKLEELNYSSRNVSIQNILTSNITQKKYKPKQFHGIYKQQIEECLNRRQVFAVLKTISRSEMLNDRNFDKYLISMAMHKLMRLNDYNACKQLYQLIKTQNEHKNDPYYQNNINYVTMSMLYVCTQFVNKYDFALSLFHDEILPNLQTYSFSDINLSYSYIINSSIVNNQFISGTIIIDQYFADEKNEFDMKTPMNSLLKFYAKFDEPIKLIDIFNKYEKYTDIYSYFIIINHYLTMDDVENMLKYINLFIDTQLIAPYFTKKTLHSSKELYYNQHIRLKIPNNIILPIANYYAQHSKINSLLILVQYLLRNVDVIAKRAKTIDLDKDLDEFINWDIKDNDDLFLNKFLKRIDINWITYKKSRDQVRIQMDVNIELSFVFETCEPDEKIWFSVLKCIGNCMENNSFSLQCNKTRWDLIDCIVTIMRKHKIYFHNNMFYGLFIHLCYNDLDKAMHFYHKIVSIAQKKQRNAVQETRNFYRDLNNLFVDDFETIYQVNTRDGLEKNVNNIFLFKPTHRELFNLLNVGCKHHCDNIKKKQLFCLWWINELKRLSVKPTLTALQLIADECNVEDYTPKLIE